MKEKNNVLASEEKVCKKCGNPLTSTSKYKYCDNCRREKAKKRREIGGTALSLCIAALGCVPVVKHFVNKD